MVGKVYSRLTVLSLSGTNKFQKAVWLCQCTCGETTIATTGALNSGTKKSCGCLKIEMSKMGNVKHGGRYLSAYNVWINMRARCDNPKQPFYHNYGGRGIFYTPEWVSFKNFMRDMGDRPVGKTLDRINNNGLYYKENCRWADRATQNRNRRNNRFLEIDGRTACLKDWCREFKIEPATVYSRIKRGWNTVEALQYPVTA